MDAAGFWQPWISQIQRDSKGNVLFTSKEIPGLIPDLLVFQEKIVTERAAEVQKIVAAWFDAVAFIKSHEDKRSRSWRRSSSKSPMRTKPSCRARNSSTWR